MREIKFRAWNSIDGRMVDWSTLKANPDFLMNIIKGIKHYDVLMQYTGLKDINGVEIYEGDIVSSDFYEPEFSEVAAVGYDEFEMRFCFNNKSGDLNGEQDAFRYGNLTVIGNIHQNPELLD